jgi:alkanesulfonate monooxygenase SsuD/methylene tetrahydromethanopterin reductase-like flavin-dependent oxidoreductase (luciferase family)
MKFGLIPLNVGAPAPEQIIATAQAAEAAGFESIWTFEHVMLPLQNRSRYPYNETGELGLAPETPLFDPLITLAALAMKTTTVRLGTGVNIVAQTNPLLLAKQLATLDVLCGGRLIFGAGIGWLQQEFDAMGVPFAGRGARFDDYIANSSGHPLSARTVREQFGTPTFCEQFGTPTFRNSPGNSGCPRFSIFRSLAQAAADLLADDTGGY